MEKQKIIRVLREVNDEIRRKYRARVEGIFGSLARGEGNEASDVDILVDFEEGANLLHLVGVSLFLEEKLGMPVDVVPIDAIRKEIRDHILKETIYL